MTSPAGMAASSVVPDLNGPQPLLTIAIPTYNCAHFLPDAIGSIMNQGLDDFEILIVDNASEDNTEEIVRSLGNGRIRYIRNEANVGSRENGNRCVAYSRGRYVKFLCADDVLLDGVLKKQLAILESDPGVALVTCNNLITTNTLEVTGAFYAMPGRHSGRRVINLCLSRLSNGIGGPSNIMFRRESAHGITVDVSYNLLSDLKFQIQLLQRGDYANIDELGCAYRRHATSDMVTNCPPEIHLPEHLRLVTEFDGWNLLNFAIAGLARGPEGRIAARERWREALSPRRWMDSVLSAFDSIHKRLTRTSDSSRVRKIESVSAAYSSPSSAVIPGDRQQNGID